MDVAEPYIGVTGLTSLEEVFNVTNLFEKEFSKNFTHVPMIGFLVSYKSLSNLPILNRRYPSLDVLPKLINCCKNKKVFPTIHYNSKEEGLAKQISSFLGNKIYQEGLCRGLQLNIPWPRIEEIEKIKENHPELKIIFQASKDVLNSGSKSSIIERISDYNALIDYVLIDPSGGNSLDFNEEFSCNFYKELLKKRPKLKIGFAGGLNGENVFLRMKSLEKTLGKIDFCIDAEGGLRDKLSPAYGDDLLNLNKVRSYLSGAKRALIN